MNKEINKGGRPLKFKTPEELKKKIDGYFEYQDSLDKPYTITGLALFLDTSRETLTEYQEKDEFIDTIKRAKNKILNQKEELLCRATGQVAGIIFDLKNNYKKYYADDSNINLKVSSGKKRLEDYLKAEDVDRLIDTE